MKLLALGAVVIAVVFVVALISPRASRRVQRDYGRVSRKGEKKGHTRGGRVGDWAGRSLTRVRHTVNRSAEAGRRGHHQIRDNVRRD